VKLLNIYGKLVNKNVSKYLINWNGKSRSEIQFKVKQFLKPFWVGLMVYEEFPVYGTLLKVDILNATLKIAIEVHGPQHGEFHYFHNNSPNAYLKSIKNDYQKSEWLEQNGFKFIEINHDEINTLSKAFFKEKFNLTL
jgi:hypothetical protein